MSSALPRPAPLPADAEWPSLASQGAAPAFAVIMRRNNRRLYRIARSILRDEVEAEEAVQETYLRAFANLHGFRGTATLSTWLARIVINEALGRLRQRRSFTGLDEIDRTAWLGQETPGALLGAFGRTSPEAAAAHQELRLLIENAVNALPAPFRVVFVSRAIEQISVEDVAASLGIPKSTVRTRLYRAKRMLREALGAAFATMLDDVFPFAGSRCERITAAVLERLGLQGSTEPIEGSTGKDRVMRKVVCAALAAFALSAAPALAAGVEKSPPPAPYKKVSQLVRLPDFLPGLGTLYVDPATLPDGPFLAYDHQGKLVSTIYMIPIKDIDEHKKIADLKSPGGNVDHVSLYFNAGHPGVEVPHYHVVLWHVPLSGESLVAK